jgi:hypothetical protein
MVMVGASREIQIMAPSRALTRAVRMLMLREMGMAVAVCVRMGMAMDMRMPVCHSTNATRKEPEPEDKEKDARDELRPDDDPVLKGSFRCLRALTHDDK